MPKKTLHLFYANSSFVHHFVAIGSFKQELQFRTVQFWWKSVIFVPCDLEIWRMTLNKANLRDLIAATGLIIFLKLDSNHQFFARVTMKFDGWPQKIKRHVFYTTSSFNLCIISDPSGNSNWRYSPETANLGQNQRFFFSLVTFEFDVWPWKTIGHLFYSTSSFVHHFVAISELKLELQSGNAKLGWNLKIFRAVWPWNLTDDLEKQ